MERRSNTPFQHQYRPSATEYGVPGRRQRSLVKPERRRQTSRTRTRELGIREHEFGGDDLGDDGTSRSCWSYCWGPTTRVLTGCCCDCCLSRCGRMPDGRVRAAWREKTALCLIIVVLCLALGFLTFGLSTMVCRPPGSEIYRYGVLKEHATEQSRWLLIHGHIYDVSPATQPFAHASGIDYYRVFAGLDVSAFFQYAPSCLSLGVSFKCKHPGAPVSKCHPPEILRDLGYVAQVAFDWRDIRRTSRTVYNGQVFDLGPYLDQVPLNTPIKPFGEKIDGVLRRIVGIDGTRALSRLPADVQACVQELFLAGTLQVKTFGCILTDIILFVSLVAILSLVFAKFFLAVGFAFVMGRRLGRRHSSPSSSSSPPSSKKDGHQSEMKAANGNNRQVELLYTILLVTCYSEGEGGLRTTLDSLTEMAYPDDRKLLFVIADGIVKGSGNDRSTPDILIDMMLPLDAIPSDTTTSLHTPNTPSNNPTATMALEPFHFDAQGHPEPKSYVALADGAKRHNMARVYVGHYRSGGHTVPMVLVVKCGAPSERTLAKPGNRGKRDSQIILMSFLSKVLFDDRLTPLEYDLFFKLQQLTKVTPDRYELVLMVDADTRVAPDALDKMNRVMTSDATVMGLCGETQIANKTQSWVTAIQVFEYYISHHSSKAFESIFGGVTCLPGCFCMYRVKAPKFVDRQRYWVPILASPDIVDAYSENVTNTLHKKNLLLLGEDRYLTTLMLKTFPRRRLLFVPSATCQTIVPDTFRVLLSQRRRWINSTVHNLFELVLVPDLCGAFCCSMQFVIFMELVGTLVLPAAIAFTGVLVINTFIAEPQWIPLGLLAAVLGLPALLLLFTTRNAAYVLWFLVYILALPLWNFVLPVYAYWHMDDFSWGETRKLDSLSKGNKTSDHNGTGEGHFDPSKIVMKRWHEFERERATKTERYRSGLQALQANAHVEAVVMTSKPLESTNHNQQTTVEVSPTRRNRSADNLLRKP
jgi:chitin synthase